RRPPPRFTSFPYTTLFRSLLEGLLEVELALRAAGIEVPGAHHVRRHHPEVGAAAVHGGNLVGFPVFHRERVRHDARAGLHREDLDRKSTRLNSSHQIISYA